MSINKVQSDGSLSTIASGARTWIGTQSAHDAAVANGTMPNNCIIAITDDFKDKETTKNITSTIVIDDSHLNSSDCVAYQRGEELIVRLGWLSPTFDATSNATFAHLPYPDGYKILTEVSGVIYSNAGEVINAYYCNNYNGRIEFRYRAGKSMTNGGYLYCVIPLIEG